jgi:hypothetical protein
MKTVILLMIIALLGQTTIKAQTNDYIPFPNQAVWHVFIWRDYSGISKFISEERYTDGDTIINGLKYIKYYDPTLNNAVRDDSVNKIVYRYNFFSKKEEVLFDFNLKVGDTVLVLDKTTKYWIKDIDSVLLLDGRYHNRYSFNDPGHIGMVPAPKLSPWIQGLGYFHSNIYSSVSEFSEGSTLYTTVCASANGKKLIRGYGYPVPADFGNCGGIITGIQAAENSDKIILYPNPVSHKLQLKWSEQNKNAATRFSITDCQGRVFLGGADTDDFIDVTTLPAGLYVIILIDKQGNLVKNKFIKQE